MPKKNISQKVAKEHKRKLVRSVRHRNGWKPPKGLFIYADKY